VPDGPAAATAWATGVKVHNKIMSETDVTERSATDGEHLKTIIEYAEEHGLSTGLITNLAPAGIADPVISASYAHLNKPPRRFSGETFLQLLNMKYGDGPDVVIGTGRQLITSQVKQSGQDLAAEIRKHGYVYLDSVAAVSKLNPASSRIIALVDDPEFDLNDAIQLAASHLSGNRKGFLLIVLVDCHLADVTKNMEQIATYDKAIRNIAEARKQDTLLMFAGNFSFDLHVVGENLKETSKSEDSREIVNAVYLEKEHTAEEAPVMAIGPGSERIRGYIPNTEIFNTIMAGLGLRP
jgi:alkaline phosphatase